MSKMFQQRMYKIFMALNLNQETDEDTDTQIEEIISDISKYSSEQLTELISEALLFSSSLSVALVSIEMPTVTEIQTSIVIDKLRLTLVGIDSWLKNNEETAVKNNDEL